MVFYNDTLKTITCNLETKIVDFKQCLKQWQHRKLTLMGKITVVKTFAFPKLVYPLTVLKNISKEKSKEITNLMFKFIWDDKPDKIKRNVLSQDYINGGLKMLDLNKFTISLKASWIKRILDTNNKGQWKEIYLNQLKNYGKDLIFNCEINKNDISRIFSNNSFLSNILSAWCDIKQMKTRNVDNSNINEEIIWNNSKLRQANKTFFYQSWFDRGIRFFKDIFNNETKKFYSFIELIDTYAIPASDFLKYMSLLSSIPDEIKIALRSFNDRLQRIVNNDNNNNSLLNKMLKTKETNKFLYKLLTKNDLQNNITSKEKWSAYFQNDNLPWDIIYNNIYISTIDIKLRNFQYKYLFRIIPTNKRLFKQSIANSNLCDFCSMCIESTEHLFWECNHVQVFWNNLNHFLTNAHIRIQSNFQIVSFGFCQQSEEDKLKNYIIFYAKYFIFLSKCHKTIPKCEYFKHYLSKE